MICRFAEGVEVSKTLTATLPDTCKDDLPKWTALFTPSPSSILVGVEELNPVVASVLVGTFTSVKYIVNVTDTINENKAQIESLSRDMGVLTDKVNLITGKLERAEGTWEMAENLYELLANRVNEMEWDIKDLNREINY